MSLRDFFRQRSILTHNAPIEVLLKVRSIIVRLESGTPYWELHGKRLLWNRRLVSIQVGSSWRILAEYDRGRVKARQVLSHSRYNHRLSMH